MTMPRGSGLDFKSDYTGDNLPFRIIRAISIIGINAYISLSVCSGSLLGLCWLVLSIGIVYWLCHAAFQRAIIGLTLYTFVGVQLNLFLVSLPNESVYIISLLPIIVAGLYLGWKYGLITLSVQVIAIALQLILQKELSQTVLAYSLFEFVATGIVTIPCFIESATLYQTMNLTRHRYAELSLAYTQTVESLSIALDLRDNETRAHSDRVTELTLAMAKRLGIQHPQDLRYIEWGARLHDIGKIGIPDSILRKPGKLTDDEWRIMKQHPVIAIRLLHSIRHLQPAVVIPRYHHERWNGSGYVEGLKGLAIPLWARIFMVADVYDALIEPRIYRPRAYTQDEVIQYLRDESDVLFDPHCVEALIDVIQTPLSAPLPYPESPLDHAHLPHQDSAS